MTAATVRNGRCYPSSMPTDRLLLAQGGSHPALLATIRNACRDDWMLCILVNVDAAQLEEKLLAAGVPRYRLPWSLTYEAKASIRASFYKGVVRANSWVLAADALSGVLKCEKVATLVIGGCERLDAAARCSCGSSASGADHMRASSPFLGAAARCIASRPVWTVFIWSIMRSRSKPTPPSPS